MLIVGLGNPGKDYEWTRHNLGFMLIDKLAHDAQIVVGRRECSALVGRGEMEGTRTKLAKPQTFMNLSGHAVLCLVRKIESDAPLKQLVVISDDLALPLGTIRIRERGSAGGHNGLKSIIAALGTQDFARVRLGVKPEHPVDDLSSFVLSPIRKRDLKMLEETVDRAADAVETILTDGVERAMARFNERVKSESEE